MVQNKKNFSSASKKALDDSQNLDRKAQTRTTDSRSQSASSTGISKGQSNLSRDKDISKRDGSSRK